MAVAFMNMDSSTLLHWGATILECPHSRRVIDVRDQDGVVTWQAVESTEPGHRERRDDLAAVLKECGALVVGDNWLMRDESRAAVDFYEAGGTVIVLPVEGIHEIGGKLNAAFGTEWRLCTVETVACAMTKQGMQDIGRFPRFSAVAHMLMVPAGEAMANEEPHSRSDFGMPADEAVDDEEEMEYAAYLTNFKPGAVVARHQNRSRGSIVWFGDSGNDPKARGLFARLCCL